MIEAMRSTVAKWAIRFLLVLLIISFGVWGIEDMFRPPTEVQSVAKIGGEIISKNQLYAQFQRSVNLINMRLGGNFDNRQAARLGILDRTLDEIIDRRLLSIQVSNLDLAVDEDIIRQELSNNPQFAGSGGRINKAAFQNFLRQQRLSEENFVAELREQIKQNQLLSALTAANQVPKALLEALYKFQNEQRIVDIVTIPYASTTTLAEPSKFDLKQYYEKNRKRFISPEYRDISVIYLDPKDISPSINPPEDKIREAFEARKESSSTPEKRDISQILIIDEKKLKKLYSSLRTGKTFNEIANLLTGKDPQKLGFLSRDDLPTPLAAIAFQTASNKVSSPVKTALGWHVVKVNSIKPERKPTFAELRPQIIRELAREMAIDEIIRITEKIDDALAAGSTLEDAALATNLDLKKFLGVDAMGKGKNGQPIHNYPSTQRFRELASQLKAGESSLIEEADDGSYFVLRVDRIIDPATRPLAEITSKVISSWKNFKKQEAAQKKAEQLMTAAKVSGLKTAAKIQGLSYASTKPFSRFIRKQEVQISGALSAEIFRAKRNALISAPDLKGYSVAQVTKVITANSSKNKNEVQMLRKTVEKALSQDIGEQLLLYLRENNGVEINKKTMLELNQEQLGG